MKEDEMITESEIVLRTGMNQSTVHKILKKNLSSMRTKQLTKRITLYDVRTLPSAITFRETGEAPKGEGTNKKANE